ncbi:hypothetical protein F53441_893 [Fusarium austroafricanum]|uniref:Uncharacterized protein n=1 Tax=Fusarium austroafricanum TaxID=2364996 RepID=A0A8H4KTD2_9HYPO|nr:hypothetical protein F53441_893 [Fusarium austroafricanum]
MTDTNATIPTYKNCDEVTAFCKVEFTVFGKYLSTGASAFFAIVFAIFLLGVGTFFEFIGYAARFALSKNPWIMKAFLIQYLTLLLAPTLVAAAISITFKHIVLWYGPQWSFLKPSLYPLVFVGSDFVSIFVQIIGGGIVASNTTGNGNKSTQKLGEGLVIGGVVFQVANMLCCAGLMLLYAKRRKTGLRSGFEQMGHDPLTQSSEGFPTTSHNNSKSARRARIFVYGIGIAYSAIIIRCIYRIFETVPATSAKLMRNEPLFYVFDGAMVLLSVGIVTILHPYKMFPFFSGRVKQQGNYNLQ